MAAGGYQMFGKMRSRGSRTNGGNMWLGTLLGTLWGGRSDLTSCSSLIRFAAWLLSPSGSVSEVKSTSLSTVDFTPSGSALPPSLPSMSSAVPFISMSSSSSSSSSSSLSASAWLKASLYCWMLPRPELAIISLSRELRCCAVVHDGTNPDNTDRSVGAAGSLSVRRDRSVGCSSSRFPASAFWCFINICRNSSSRSNSSKSSSSSSSSSPSPSLFPSSSFDIFDPLLLPASLWFSSPPQSPERRALPPQTDDSWALLWVFMWRFSLLACVHACGHRGHL